MELNYRLSKERKESVERALDRLRLDSDGNFLYELQSIDDLVTIVNEKLAEVLPNKKDKINDCISAMSTVLFLRDLYIYIATSDNVPLKPKKNG